MTDDPLLDSIADSFIESAAREGFNGVAASTLQRLEPDQEKLRGSLSALVRDGQITAVFSRHSVNMYWSRPALMDGLGLRRVYSGHCVSFRIRWGRDSRGPSGGGT
jgi:hypothetical protein